MELNLGRFTIEGSFNFSITRRPRQPKIEPEAPAPLSNFYAGDKKTFLIDHNIRFLTRTTSTERLVQSLERWCVKGEDGFLQRVLAAVNKTHANLDTAEFHFSPAEGVFMDEYSKHMPSEDLTRPEHDENLKTARYFFDELKKSIYISRRGVDYDLTNDRARRLDTGRTTREVELTDLLLRRVDLMRKMKTAA